MLTLNELKELCNKALLNDKSLSELTTTGEDKDDAFILKLTSATDPQFREDIASVWEMFSLLQHKLNTLPEITDMDTSVPIFHMKPGLFQTANNDFICTFKVGKGELQYFAHWCSGLFGSSNSIKELSGSFSLLFTTDGTSLIPSWLSVFFVDGNSERAIPFLSLKSAERQFNGVAGYVDDALLLLKTRFNIQTKKIDFDLENLIVKI